MMHSNTILTEPVVAAQLSPVQAGIIADVILKLNGIVAMASADFSFVGSLLKTRSDPSGRNWVSPIVTELQYIDILKQKVDHMIGFLEDINLPFDLIGFCEKETDRPGTWGLVFKLNFLQLNVAQSDFVKSVESIQSKLREGKNQGDTASEFNIEPEIVCKNFKVIVESMDDVSRSLARLSEEYPATPGVRALSIVHHLLKQYTMESEREVLRWCMDQLEGKFAGQLKIDDLKEDQIQLF